MTVYDNKAQVMGCHDTKSIANEQNTCRDRKAHVQVMTGYDRIVQVCHSQGMTGKDWTMTVYYRQAHVMTGYENKAQI